MLKKIQSGALGKTTKEYASHTTIHGISYTFNKDVGWLESILWFLVVLGFLALAGFFTSKMWTQWREEQVLNKDSHHCGCLSKMCVLGDNNLEDHGLPS